MSRIIELQREYIIMAEVRSVLDVAIEFYPEMDSRLNYDAEIVMFPHF